MRRFNLRERWKARTYTPFVLVPYSWLILITLYYVFGVDALGYSETTANGETVFHFSTDSNDPSGAIFIVVLIGGSVVAFMRRRTRRFALVQRGWVVKWRGLRMLDGRFHLFPFGHLKRVRLTSAAYGNYLGASCASVSLWPRWQAVRRFYDVDLVELSQVLPPLALFPARQYEKVAAALGGTDILTESDAFNRRWRVVGRDSRYALAVLHPLMMEFLAQPGFDDLPISIEGGAIMTWHPGRSQLAMLGTRLMRLHGIAALIPRFVWDEFGTPRPAKWGPAGVILGPQWDAAQKDPSAVELYPSAAEAAALVLPPAVLEYARGLGDTGSMPQPGPVRPGEVDSTVTDTVGTFFPSDFDASN